MTIEKATTAQFSLDRFASDLLSLNWGQEPTEELLCHFIALLKKDLSIESVGVRFQMEDDFPYFFAIGHSANFVKKEMSVCAHNEAGKIQYDASGKAILECVCGSVLCGHVDPSSPNITEVGSFWCNNTDVFDALPIDPVFQKRVRGTCVDEGYQSIALIPMKAGNTIHGLMQLCDRRQDFFVPPFIQTMESVASFVGTLLSSNPLVSKSVSIGHGHVEDKETLIGLIPICSMCKKVKNENGEWEEIEAFFFTRTRVLFSHSYCSHCVEQVFKDTN